jgi:hypothetical protein
VLVLDTHNTTAPVSSESCVVVVSSSEGSLEEFEILIVFLSYISDGNASSSLLVDELTESCLSLNEGEGDTLLSAELRKENHHLKGVNVVSNNDKLSSVGFNEFGNVVKTEFQDNWLRSLVLVALVNLILSFLLKSGLLFFVSFRTVLSK